MNAPTLALLAAATLLSGCTTSYQWDVDRRTGQVYLAGTHQTFDAEKAAQVVDGITQGVGQFATGYAEAAAEYEYTHPTVYVQPQHGVMTGYANGQPVWINY